MQGHLTSFQKTMLQWNDLFPYNAVHGVRLAGSFAPDAGARGIRATLERLGLTGYSLDRQRGTFRYRGGNAQHRIELVLAGSAGWGRLEEVVQRELNTAFDTRGEFEPFRFFVAQESGAFWLGLTYFHPVADAESIVRLLRELACAVQGRADPGASTPWELHTRKPEGVWGRRAGGVLRAATGLLRSVRQARRYSCAPNRDPADRRNGVGFFTLSPGSLPALKAAGRAWGVTFNDLVLAALLRALSPLAGDRWQASRRRRIGVGVIVNKRTGLREGEPWLFGSRLGFFQVAHEVPGGIGMRSLAQAVGGQTRAAKRSRDSGADRLQLAVARVLYSRCSQEARPRFYPRRCPLWGGVTNVNLDGVWQLRPQEGELDYFRAVSTGPATPLVVSVTTVPDRVNMGLSYRAGAYSPAEVQRVREGLEQAVEEVKQGA